MPRKSRAKNKEIGEPASAIMELLNEQGADLKPASELPRQLPDPRTEAEQPLPELIEPDPNTTRPRPSHKLNGTERESKGAHSAAVLASRASFRPIPVNFVNVDSYPVAGLKVNRSRDKTIASIQFADDQLPSREEKDFLQVRGVNYDPLSKQWTRRDAENPGANLVDLKDVAAEVADLRKVLGR